MKNLINIISIAILAVSCSATSLDNDNPAPELFTGIEGSVTDTIGNPIEHIKVTITISEDKVLTVYSGSDGKFTAGLDLADTNQQYVDIKLEDIDGEENGGCFATKTDRITVATANTTGEPVILHPIYHLSLATVWENIPQI